MHRHNYTKLVAERERMTFAHKTYCLFNASTFKFFYGYPVVPHYIILCNIQKHTNVVINKQFTLSL